MSTPQTAMSAAFTKAGFKPIETPADALRRMMRAAITAGGGKADASRDHFIAALVKAEDPALLWELFAAVRQQVISALFTETIVEMRAERALPNAGEANEQSPHGHSSRASPATQTEDAATGALPQGQPSPTASSVSNAAAGATYQVPEGHGTFAPAAAPQRPSRLRYESTEKIARLSILRTFRINGQPLAEVTGAEARAWLKTQQRDGRFVALVAYQVPDEIKIGAIVPEDEADKMFKLATEAGNA